MRDVIFVIGNGPSLSAHDLDKIVGRPSIACNRINLIYPKTSWRPSIYVHPESPLDPDIPYIRENLDLGIHSFLGEYFQRGQGPFSDGLEFDTPGVEWINDCHHHAINFDSPDMPDEWHLPGLCTFGGSVNVAMQIAVKIGYKTIVLLGCDSVYSHKPNSSHFVDTYENGRELPSFYRTKNAVWSHVCALNYIRRRKMNVNIFNATRGGLLEIWPRAQLEWFTI